ncbi:Cation-transporting atpase [Thalictrum thalictroides]|uniref:Cation-transporting atpase n=1 Tax=Thalictrum thalictroides TaxID=46969 RepID=A0A7J6V4G7_THATH|nr:Cation-transporting atpase [Thalictrum thalictroides]
MVKIQSSSICWLLLFYIELAMKGHSFEGIEIESSVSETAYQLHSGKDAGSTKTPKAAEDLISKSALLKNVSSTFLHVDADQRACPVMLNRESDVAKTGRNTRLACVNNNHNYARSPVYSIDIESEDTESDDDLCDLSIRKDDKKFSEASELRSSTGALCLKKTDSFYLWQKLKEKDFVSSSLVGIQIPKPHVERSKRIPLKERNELAKREDINKPRKIAAPTGLLHELNPGIISRVRSSKQVHSIIEAVVKSENGTNDFEGEKGRYGDSDVPDKREAFGASHFSSDQKDAMILGSSHNKVPGDQAVCPLSVTAATVSSRWLDLLYQDTKGRLNALRRSKKRVQTFIQMELPLLLSKGLTSQEENCPQSSQSSAGLFPNSTTSDWHGEGLDIIFRQMEKALCEEEKHLECFYHQVRLMYFRCASGLQSVNQSAEQLDRSGKDGSKEAAEMLEKRLAIKAAAAAIYSTCNFITSNR